MGRRLDPGGHPDQHPLGAVEQPIGQLDLVERVEDQVADPGVEGVAELGLGLVVAVQVDPRSGSKPAASATWSSPPEATSTESPSSRITR